jgi:hypothetical protein
MLNGAMKYQTLTLLECAIWGWASFGWADVALRPGTEFEFASVEQGRAIVCARDEYLLSTRPFDRAIRTREPFSGNLGEPPTPAWSRTVPQKSGKKAVSLSWNCVLRKWARIGTSPVSKDRESLL